MMSDYILTYTKTKFYPLEPVKTDINIVDIAHALSLMTRANGHFKLFYSVAQHSINCFKEAKSRGCSSRIQLGCLLHDASESYISDLTRPVKKNLPQYFMIEDKLQRTIYEWFGIGDLSDDELQQIKDIDDALLYYEFQELMGITIADTKPVKSTSYDFLQRDFVSVEQEFIDAFNGITGKSRRYSCIGIDACEGKWIAVYIDKNGFEALKFKTISDICNHYPNCDSYIIDIPIGLPEEKSHLRPDMIIKKMLGKKGSSIFQVPCRQAIYANDKTEARELNISTLGKSLSEQSLGIAKAIRQVDEFLQNNPQWKNRLLESHPEFCFSKLNNNQPILEDKMSAEGQQKRLEVLSKYYSQANQVVDKFLSDIPYRKKIDDVIDALCLAIMGKVIIEKGMKTIPEKPMMDSKGILMQMVYAE